MANTVTFGGLTTGATTATNTAETRAGFMITGPGVLAADLVSIVSDVLMANGALVLAGQPDFARKLQVRKTDADSSVSAGIVTIVGVDTSGIARSETVALTGGTATVLTTWAYRTVTSATVSGLAGNGVGDNIGIGMSAALGLCGTKSPAPSGFAVFAACVDNVIETVGTVDATAGAITPTTAPNATHSYTFSYTYSVTPTQASHTHDSVSGS